MSQLISNKYLPIFFLILAGVCASHTTRSEALKIYTEVTPVLSFLNSDGELVGSSVEIVRAIQKMVGNNDPIEIVPWARGYSYITQPENSNIVLFSGAYTQQRHNLFKWVGPIASVSWDFFATDDSDLEINSLEDAKAVAKIGVVIKDVRVSILQQHGFTNLVGVSNNDQNIKMLLRKRIDLWFGDAISIRGYSKQQGINPIRFKSVYHYADQGLFIMFHHNTPDAIVEQWQRAYWQLVTNGTIGKIAKKWGITVPGYHALTNSTR